MKTASTARLRLDQHLHEAGLFDSREKAQRAILAGQVTVGGRIADKPGTKVSPESEILITGRDRYVGRGGHKLEGALTGFGIDPTGLSCLDLGSSTGASPTASSSTGHPMSRRSTWVAASSLGPSARIPASRSAKGSTPATCTPRISIAGSI